MQDLLLKIGGRQVVVETIDALNKKYEGIMRITTQGELEDVLLTVENEDLFYAKLKEEKDLDFNDVKFRMAYLLHELLKEDAYLNINDLAENMNVSRGTVNNDVKKLKQTLEKYSCKIVGVPNKGIHFEGEEFHKRLVLLYEVFDYMPLSKTVDRTFVETVKDVAHHYGLSDMNMRLLYKAAILSSDRVKNGFHLTGNIPMYKNFELAKISMGVLQEDYGLPGNDVDTSYLAVYYALILDERKKPSEVRKGTKHVAVVTNRGRGTFELIKRQLQEIIGEESQVDALSLLDLTKKDISKYHILFSTENILTDVHLPVIAIDGIIDEEALSKKIHELEEKRLGYIEQRLSEMYLEIRDLTEKKTYREQVSDIAEGLRAKGYASDRIYDLFLQKESVSSMIYENGVAFPHLTDPKATKMSLVLGVPQNKKDKIQLIFFLVIPENLVEEEEELLMEIYDEIFRIVSDKEQVRKLQQVQSITEFIGLLMKGK